MGCDIHAHVEVKIDGEWLHWSALDIRRCYELFAKMANVRNYEDDDGRIVPISEPRGIPADVTDLTKMDSDRWDSDAHSQSWLSAQEMEVAYNWIHSYYPRSTDFLGLFGYVFGNYPWDFDEEDLQPASVTDARLVFWFDN